MKARSEIYNELSRCKSDVQRWNCVVVNRHQENMPEVTLDNDDTYIVFGDEDIINFDEYVGWSDGVQTLLSAIGIKADPC